MSAPRHNLFAMPQPAKQRRVRHPAPKGDLYVKVGARLRELRDHRRLSQAQLGAPNFTRAHVSAVELGKVAPSLKTPAFFAQKLGVRLRDLIPDDLSGLGLPADDLLGPTA